MKYLSLFSGIGGFEIGINNAFHNRRLADSESVQPDGDKPNSPDTGRGRSSAACIGYSEIDPYADAIYKYNFGGQGGNNKSRGFTDKSEEKNPPNTQRNKSISKGQQDTDDTRDNRPITNPEDPNRTLLQDRQVSGDTESRNMGEIKENSEVGQQIRQGSNGLLRKGDGVRDNEESLFSAGNITDISNIKRFTNNHGGNYGDITAINPKELPDFDLLVGGFPCQAFSIAGKRRGFDDTRGTLIYDVFRILKEKQPRHFILENVKGLLSHDSGNTFRTIITSLEELGYAIEWQVLNAKNFGVPQNRERVFIVGHLGGFGGRQVFPITGSDSQDIQTHQASDCARTITTAHAHSTGKHMSYIAKTVRTGGRGSTTAKHNWDTYGVNGKIRRLTPTECERLMGYPDDWTKYGLYGPTLNDIKRLQEQFDPPYLAKFPEVKEMSDTRRYKSLGNGVVSNCVEEIVRRLYEIH